MRSTRCSSENMKSRPKTALTYGKAHFALLMQTLMWTEHITFYRDHAVEPDGIIRDEKHLDTIDLGGTF